MSNQDPKVYVTPSLHQVRIRLYKKKVSDAQVLATCSFDRTAAVWEETGSGELLHFFKNYFLPTVKYPSEFEKNCVAA